jgi:peptidoglycan/xylan/chitin deacetylase (PgdA/CDA1 family)
MYLDRCLECCQITKLIRTPNGDVNPRVIKKLRKMGYTTIQWSVDLLGWTNPGVETIVRRVLTKAQAGDIILMHSSDSAKQTKKALPSIIDALRKRGFQLVTVFQLLNL